MEPRYNVLIVGAGNIGAFFDIPDSDNILTHAHAFTKHKGFNLAGFVDLDTRKAIKAVSIWGGKAFKNIEEALAREPGLSDHTLGIATSIAAVALGARLIEKHFTLSRKIKTLDSFFSMEPNELRDLITNVRMAEKAIGKENYAATKREKLSKIFRRSLFAVKDIKKGTS